MVKLIRSRVTEVWSDRRAVLAGAALIGTLPATSSHARSPSADVDQKFIGLLGRDVRAPQPLGDYVPARAVGNIVYLSTTPAKEGAKVSYPGALGQDVDLATGRLSAYWATLTLLENLWVALDGSLSTVKQVVNLTGYVSSAPNFTRQAEVMDGGSEVLIKVFGEKAGRPTRSAVGVQQMPHGASVGVSGIVEVYNTNGRTT